MSKITKFRMCLSVVLCFAFLGSSEADAQRTAGSDLSVPKSEKFAPTDALLTPWRNGHCAVKGKELLGNRCLGIYGLPEYESASIVNLYNADGSLWREMSLDPQSENYFGSARNNDFVPFGTHVEYRPQNFVIRLIGESTDWYEVEVNEATRETKFALRDEKMWTKTKWDGWLYFGVSLYLGDSPPYLMETPGGSTLPDSNRFTRVRFLEAKGDWA